MLLALLLLSAAECRSQSAHVEFSAASGDRGYVIDLVCDERGPRWVRWDQKGADAEPVKREGAVSSAKWAAAFRAVRAVAHGPNYACPEETGKYDLYYLRGYYENDEYKQICRTARLPKKFVALFRALEEAAR